jgi:hypothetical protein
MIVFKLTSFLYLLKLLSFLSLPPEIRNAVYEYPCIYRTKSSRMDPRRGLIFTDLSQAPITRVNKTIRRETLPLFYGNHKFVCEVPKPPKEFYGPRQNRYHLDSIWERLRDFDPPARHPIISNLRFLSQVTILLEVESRYFTRLGFTMSSKALVQNELAHEEWPMDTAVVYRDNMAHVVAAFIHAIAFSKPCRDARFFYHVHGISPSHLERAAIGLSSTIRSISRECPQLKSSVIAIIEPARAMARTMIP